MKSKLIVIRLTEEDIATIVEALTMYSGILDEDKRKLVTRILNQASKYFFKF